MSSHRPSISCRVRRPTALTCLSLAMSAALAAAQGGIPGYVVLPLTLMEHANQATVSAEVNGQRTLLMLDTGATMTVLDSAFYHRSLLRNGEVKPSELPPELRKKTDANGQKADFSMVNSLKLGGLDLGKRPVVTTDLSETLGRRDHGGRGPTGLVGEDLLQEYGAIIDWARHGVYLNVDKSKRLKLGPALVAAGWTAVPMAPTNGRHFNVQAMIEGKKVRLIVDTGAPFTILNPGELKLGKMMYNNSQAAFTGSHIQSTGMNMTMINFSSTAYLARIEHWKVGDFEIASSVVSVSSTGSLLHEKSAGEGPVAGLLGAEVMARHHAIIDVANSALYLKH